MKRYAGLLVLVMAFVVGLASLAYGAEIVKIGMQDEPKTLNPLKASDVWSWNVLNGFYDALYSYSPVDFNVIPILATGNPVYSKDGLQATIKLKKGVKWSDGKPFTADDVVFTYNNIMIKHKIPRYLSRNEFIDKVEKIDDYTVKFHLKEKRATFVHGTLQGPILPKHQWASIVAEAEKTTDPLKALLEYDLKNPVGTGPFQLQEWNLGNYLTVKQNASYHDKGRVLEWAGEKHKLGPYVDGVLFKFYKSIDAAVMALQKGDVHYVWWSIPPGLVPQMVRNKKITMTNNPENGMRYLAFNFLKEPFNNAAFRQAAATMVDKEFIVNRVLQTYGTPLYTVVPPGNKSWYNDAVKQWGKGLSKDVRKKQAVEILKNAGYTWKKSDDKSGVYEGLIMPNGKPVPAFDILTPPADYDPFRAMAGLLIQEWWRELGIPANSKPSSFGVIVDKVFTQMDFDVFILGWQLTVFPDYLRDFFHSSQAIPDGNNPMSYKNKEFDKLSDQFVETLDQAEAVKIAFKLQEFIANELPYIPLYSPNKVEGYRNDEFTGWIEDQLDGLGSMSTYWSILNIQPVK